MNHSAQLMRETVIALAVAGLVVLGAAAVAVGVLRRKLVG